MFCFKRRFHGSNQAKVIAHNFLDLIQNIANSQNPLSGVLIVPIFSQPTFLGVPPDGASQSCRSPSSDEEIGSTNALVIAQRRLIDGTITLRNGAKLVMVVVTDDNAMSVTDLNFISGLNAAIQAIKPTLFAFRGVTDQGSCNITRAGLAYDNLATATGGDVFDICAPDWTPNFNKLAESVAMIAGTSFKIDDPALDVVTQVTLDGVVLDPADFRVSGDTIQLVSKVVKPTSKEVGVRYKTKSKSANAVKP